MKILHVIPSLGVGGTEKMLGELCRGLDRSRFESSVVALKTGGRTAFDLEQSGFPVTILNSPDGLVAGLFDHVRLYSRLRTCIHRERPHVIHTWLTRANVIGRLAGSGTGIPVVSSLRVIEGEKRYHVWAERLSQGACRFVTVNCTPLQEFAVRRIGIPENKVVLIFNGIRIGAMPSPRPASEAVPTIGTLGRLHAQKGVDVFLAAAKRILERKPNVRFLIGGDGPEKDALMGLAAELRIGDRVQFLGTVSSADFFSEIDVFVLSSRWEGMPNVVLEAMASAKPIAATRVGGVTDLIGHESEGLLIPPDDSDALAGAVLRLVDSESSARAYAEAAFQKVSRHFSMETMVRAHEALYDEANRTS